jgi:hypothetical protein
MQLRSRNITSNATPKPVSKPSTATKPAARINLEIQDLEDVHYKSYKSIVGLLEENFRKLNALDSCSLERIKIVTIIFKLVQSKILEIIYLKDDSRYVNIKKLFLVLKNKIPELIRSITDIMNTKIDLDDEKIEEISSCLNLLMKLRKQFK